MSLSSKGIDLEFVKMAERLTSFNLSAKHFQTLDHKVEIRYLFNKHFFPGVEVDTPKTIELDGFNNVVSSLKAYDVGSFVGMHEYPLKGIGPGEVSIFFAIDTARLGGGCSAGVDVVDDSGEREVKAVKVTRDGYARDFKLGGTVDLSSIMGELFTLKAECGIETGEGVSSNVLREVARIRPNDFKRVSDLYRDACRSYFQDHEVIFLNHNTSPKVRGRIEAIKTVDGSDVEIDALTSGTIKPRIRLWRV